MSDRFDDAVWSGIERRLASVEAFVPAAPPWQPAAHVPASSGFVGLGRTLRPQSADVRPRRARLALAFAVIVMLLALIAGALLVGSLRPDRTVRDERFWPYGLLRQGDGEARAVLLADGRTMIVSGEWQGIGNTHARADTWDPVAGFVSIDPPTVPRVNPTTTLLLDGRVLVIGGYGGPYQYSSSAIVSAEVWDPTASTFAPTGSMAAARVGHTATMLPDGRVLVVGGAGPDGDAAQAELWDPGTSEFSPAGTLAHARRGHAAVLLLDGRVAIAGGVDPSAGTGVGVLEIWDPSSLQFHDDLGLLDAPRNVSLTRLADGRVLLAGAFVVQNGLRGALIWDPAASASQSLKLTGHRDAHAATLLADGRVLLTGGMSQSGDALESVELWDPEAGRFVETRPLPRPAANHTAVLLPDGRLLIVLDGSGPDGVVEPFLYEPE